MAVENCTVSTVSITALGGSTLVAGTKTLIITPDADFYVSASLCSVGNAMETFSGSNIWNTVGANVTTGITQVQFVDVGDGTVEAIITHGAISISSSTEDFFVDIDVTAAPPRVFSCVQFQTSHNEFGDGGYSSSSTQLDVSGMTEYELLNTSSDHIVRSSGEVSATAGELTLMTTVRLTAASGFFFQGGASGTPGDTILDGAAVANPEYWQTNVSNYVYDGDYITGFDFNIYYVTPSVSPAASDSESNFCDLGHKITLRTKPNSIPTQRARSYSVDGVTTEEVAGYDAGPRSVSVQGEPGSRFEFFVENEDGEIYDFVSGTFSREIKRDKVNYFEIPKSGRWTKLVNYPSSYNAAKSYSYFVEGAYTPAKASVGGEAGVSKNLIEASTTSLGSGVPSRSNKTTKISKPRQTVLLKVTQSASVHTIPSASSTGVSLYGLVNEVPKRVVNIKDPDIPYTEAPHSISKIDFSFSVTLGGSKAWATTGGILNGATLYYAPDANTVTAPEYRLLNGSITSTYSAGASATFAGTLYVDSFGEVNGDGVYQLEIYLDNFIKAA